MDTIERMHALIELPGKLPGVYVERKGDAKATFYIQNKIFAFTRKNDVVVKLPEATIAALVKQKKAAVLVMGARAMREWAVVAHASPAEIRKDLPLFQEAMAFVSAEATAAAGKKKGAQGKARAKKGATGARKGPGKSPKAAAKKRSATGKAAPAKKKP